MSLPFWFRRRFVRKPSAPARRPARWRPTLEALEDRLVLSTFIVNNTNDSGAGSLRQAILDANAAPGADVITFDPTVFSTPQTIRLLSMVPNITGDLTIEGPTAARLTISGYPTCYGGTDRGDALILNVSAGDLTLSDLTLTNGPAQGDGGAPWIRSGDAGYGGGILVNARGAVTLNDCTLSCDTVETQDGRGDFGGAGYSCGIEITAATVTLNNSTLSSDTVETVEGGRGGFGGAEHGGGIVITAGTITLNNSTLSNDTDDIVEGGHRDFGDTDQGGIFLSARTVTLNNSTLSNDTDDTREGGSGDSSHLITLVSSGLNLPAGVAVDRFGNVFIADTRNNLIEEWQPYPRGLFPLVDGLNGPAGVAVDDSGNVFIADTGNNAIKEWQASTRTVSTLVSSGLSFPNGVAVDRWGYVYIADTFDSAIKQLLRAAEGATPPEPSPG
jgi:hypothetical protein